MWIPELYTFLLQFRGCTGAKLTLYWSYCLVPRKSSGTYHINHVLHLLGVGVVKGGVSRMHHNNAGVCCAEKEEGAATDYVGSCKGRSSSV